MKELTTEVGTSERGITIGDGFNFVLGALLAVILIYGGVQLVIHSGGIAGGVGKFFVGICLFLFQVASSPIVAGIVMGIVIMLWVGLFFSILMSKRR